MNKLSFAFSNEVEIPLRDHFITIQDTDKIKDILSSCKNCNIRAKMSSIPMGSFAAMKARESREKMISKEMHMEESEGKYLKKYCIEPTPMKYSSKLMNSIWGMYNRYSVHNFKKNINGCVPAVVEGQLI